MVILSSGSRVLEVLLILSTIGALASCVVDGEQLEGRVFYCDQSRDCGEGYTCYTAFYRFLEIRDGFCTRSCDLTCTGLGCQDCDGYCTPEGACLTTCDPDSKGACPGSFHCLRTQLDGLDPAHGPEGICTPVQTCDDTSQCPDGRLCLSDLYDPAFYQVDHLFCVPQVQSCDPHPCDREWYCAESASSHIPPTYFCLPPCDAPFDTCPPGMACLIPPGEPRARTCTPSSGDNYWCEGDINCLTTYCSGRTCSLSN